MADLAILETFLDTSTQALKAGSLADLTALSDQAEAALNAAGKPDAAVARRLRDKAMRNQALILAALKGVKAARQRARDLASAGQFSTYDAAGQRNQVGEASLPLGRRV